jgi:hypothetical protein
MAKPARPKARPSAAPTSSKRPPKNMPEALMLDAPSPREEEPMKKMMGGKVMKKAKGGMCRGMGAAKKGGKYMKNG